MCCHPTNEFLRGIVFLSMSAAQGGFYCGCGDCRAAGSSVSAMSAAMSATMSGTSGSADVLKGVYQQGALTP